MPNNPHEDFTLDQAHDLANYFIGPGIRVIEGTEWVALGGSRCWYNGDTWRAAFRAAGVKLPYRSRYVSIDRQIILDDEQVAICKSANFATRTANALNAYIPDRRGQ